MTPVKLTRLVELVIFSDKNMSNQSYEELREEKRIQQALEKKEEHFDKKYAIKLVERIVFTMIGTIVLGFLMYLINSSFRPV